MDLSISIVSWNTRDILDACLKSVYSHAGSIDFEVIVVDNASSDGSVEMVSNRYPEVKVIVNHSNVGFASANNQAYGISSGDFFMLLNSDTIVQSSLESVVNFLRNNPSIGVAGCHCLNADGSLQQNWYDYYPSICWELLPESMRLAAYKLIYNRSVDETFDTKWIGGQCMTLRRACIEQVGSMDEGYFMYSEETDWCYRIRRRGWRICHWPGLTITHFGGQSTRQMADKMLVQLYRSKTNFMRRHYGRVYASAFKFLLMLRTGVLLCAVGLRSALSGDLRRPRSIFGLLKETVRL
ncbi:MAG: glycosyltransferase family 2 protein [Armatimonadota bacterium]